jgi:hypothetical protein
VTMIRIFFPMSYHAKEILDAHENFRETVKLRLAP